MPRKARKKKARIFKAKKTVDDSGRTYLSVRYDNLSKAQVTELRNGISNMADYVVNLRGNVPLLPEKNKEPEAGNVEVQA